VATWALPEVIPEAPLVVKAMCKKPKVGSASSFEVIVVLVALVLVNVPSKRLEVNSVTSVERVKTVTVPLVNVHVAPA
jgi:hypothetical protein